MKEHAGIMIWFAQVCLLLGTDIALADVVAHGPLVLHLWYFREMTPRKYHKSCISWTGHRTNFILSSMESYV